MGVDVDLFQWEEVKDAGLGREDGAVRRD